MSAPMSPEQRAEIAALLGPAEPATDRALLAVAEAVRDVREHDHSTQYEDWFCMNLSSYAGGKAGPLVRRLLDAEAELAARPSRADALREARDFVREAHFTDGMSVQEVGVALGYMADAAEQAENGGAA